MAACADATTSGGNCSTTRHLPLLATSDALARGTAVDLVFTVKRFGVAAEFVFFIAFGPEFVFFIAFAVFSVVSCSLWLPSNPSVCCVAGTRCLGYQAHGENIKIIRLLT